MRFGLTGGRRGFMVTNAAIIHKGKQYPNYLDDFIHQFFLTNKDTKLYCIVDESFEQLLELQKQYEQLYIVLSNDINITKEHLFFLRFNRLTRQKWRDGFWRFVVERFFILYDFMSTYCITSIYHFEYDNAIYADLTELEQKLSSFKAILLPADADKRCIPGFVYIPEKEILREFCCFYNRKHTLFPKNDMIAFSEFMEKKTLICKSLPVIPPSYYFTNKKLISTSGKTSNKPWVFYENYEKTRTLFDAAAFGQYLGGIDPRNGESKKGFINETAVYSPADFQVIWKHENSIKKPFIVFQGEEYPLANLHIHSKNLKEFRSDLI